MSDPTIVNGSKASKLFKAFAIKALYWIRENLAQDLPENDDFFSAIMDRTENDIDNSLPDLVIYFDNQLL